MILALSVDLWFFKDFWYDSAYEDFNRFYWNLKRLRSAGNVSCQIWIICLIFRNIFHGCYALISRSIMFYSLKLSSTNGQSITKILDSIEQLLRSARSNKQAHKDE